MTQILWASIDSYERKLNFAFNQVITNSIF